jgi:hypothetical protein
MLEYRLIIICMRMLSLSILTVLENHFFCTTDCRFCFDRNLAPKQGAGARSTIKITVK